MGGMKPGACGLRLKQKWRGNEMQEFSLANQKLGQWIRMEHYRLHSAETLPDGPYKEAVLAAIHSGLKRLKEASSAPFEPPVCTICASRRAKSVVLEFPGSKRRTTITRLAA